MRRNILALLLTLALLALGAGIAAAMRAVSDLLGIGSHWLGVVLPAGIAVFVLIRRKLGD